MSLQRRFTMVLAVLVGLLMLLWLGVHRRESRWQQRAAAEQKRETMEQLRHWVQADAAAWLRQTRTLADDPALQQIASTDKNTLPALAPLTWWLDSAGSVRAGPGPTKPPPELPWQDPAFAAALDRAGTQLFHLPTADGVHEACLVRTGGSDNHNTTGVLLQLRPWSTTRLGQLGALAGVALHLRTDDAAVESGALPLNDWQGRPVAWLLADFTASARPSAFEPDPPVTAWFIAFGVLVVIAVALALRRWVLQPLGLITRSLAAGDPAPVQPLAQNHDEMGALSRLVQSSFRREETLRQREAELQRSIDERIRLGRDLHDGIIQSLYATGMGLAGIKSRLLPDQTDVAEALEQSRAALNGTILDLRHFITGLEPESLQQQSFSQAVITVLDNARQARPVQTECAVDDELAARLTIGQRAHILQITREAVSNALRHGAANCIRVSLFAAHATAVFEIEDNGRGFDPVAGQGNGGHGLSNLANRATEIGARFSLESKPGQGTRLRLVLNPRPSLSP